MIPFSLEQARLVYAPTSPSLLTVYPDDTAAGHCSACGRFISRTPIHRETVITTSFGTIECAACGFQVMIYREPAY